jgi:DNA sulfur modification protein DndB
MSAGEMRVKIPGMLGFASHREVLIGFAPASLLNKLSFADVLNEDTGHGYQRRFNPQHSLDFRKYIQQDTSSTIPLTFNLRPRSDDGWTITRGLDRSAILEVSGATGKVLSQVDCQHRLGYLNDVDIELPFMCFIALTEREEMEIFQTINTKAKGLSSSLLDFHDASLASDLADERPELFIALHLNSNNESPWYRQLDLGGDSTSGLMRRASLRTVQSAVKRFLRQTKILKKSNPVAAATVLLNFWAAVAVVLRREWDSPRHFLLNKGVGVYALTSIAADLYLEATGAACDKRYFTAKLSEFISEIDWSTNGPLRGFGGESGVASAVSLIREKRRVHGFRIVANG